MDQAKTKAAKHKNCKYCGAKTLYKQNVCGNCIGKRQLMQGWNWEYNPKEKIKIK